MPPASGAAAPCCRAKTLDGWRRALGARSHARPPAPPGYPMRRITKRRRDEEIGDAPSNPNRSPARDRVASFLLAVGGRSRAGRREDAAAHAGRPARPLRHLRRGHPHAARAAAEYGDKLFLTKEEAEKIAEQESGAHRRAATARAIPTARRRPRVAPRSAREAPRVEWRRQRRRLQHVLDRSRHRRLRDRRQVPHLDPRRSRERPVAADDAGGAEADGAAAR